MNRIYSSNVQEYKKQKYLNPPNGIPLTPEPIEVEFDILEDDFSTEKVQMMLINGLAVTFFSTEFTEFFASLEYENVL